MSATALYKALLEAGTSEALAEKAIEGVLPVAESATKSDIVRLEARMDEFATKSDIVRLEGDITRLEVRMDEFATKSDVVRLEARMDEFATKSDVVRLGGDIVRLETRMLRWNMITASVIIAAMGLIVKL